ncbi:hypothetical protein L6164_030957 [Bauhinia variegata]|uniref:Uncharacterized protein n=1 Tax=Bauhinia variegata TaxID=167791 RepID=A0ACB9LEB5_BAUVA|nr:hypothetical protein L6164_030957 [Bauhinia variegata]
MLCFWYMARFKSSILYCFSFKHSSSGGSGQMVNPIKRGRTKAAYQLSYGIVSWYQNCEAEDLGCLITKEGKKQSEEATEKWIKYYSSNHQILLVGEGDFSFSLCLAHSFASASNIVASSLDSYDDVTKKYKEAKSNLENLEKLGACLLHELDATKMELHPDLRMRRFDRVIFNFPHAGFHGKEDNPSLIEKHKALVHGFFTNAKALLRANGEIHVNHKTEVPYSNWNLEKLASQSSLLLIKCADFKKDDYPGYNNKRGASLRCDEPFPLGKCCTFKFIDNPRAIQQRNPPRQESQVLQRPTPVGLNYFPQTSHILKMNAGLPLATSSRNEHYQIFGGNSDSVLKIQGTTPDGIILVVE